MKAQSEVSGATPSTKEPESGQNQDETPKSSKKICFCCEKMETGKVDSGKMDTERMDTEKMDTEKAEEDSSVFKDRPTMLKVPSKLERKTSNPSITSLAEVMIKEDAIKNPLLFAKSRTGSKCYVIPLKSQTDFTERKLSMSEEEEEANIISSYNCICGVMWACIIVLLLMAKLNRQLTHILLGGVDGAASFVVMVGIIMFVVTSFLFLIVQSYGEAFHMIQVCGNVINSTIVNNPELSAYLPEGMESMLDNTLNNAYVYGREGLISLIRSLLGSEESEAREKLESQVLELWDRVYQAWVMGSSSNTANGPHVTDEAVLSSWDNLLDTVKKTPALTNFNAWSQFAQENLETVTSLLTSVWMLLKGNITLVITIVTTLLSVVFGGGSALFGFFISTIVFLTALFYLLNSSGQQYKPVEMISILSPSNGQRIGKAFEAAINGVFEASFKMAVFYGMWTWFIHNIFQMQIVYIPTALAALLAAIPVLGVYWASLPAVIDLWLAQGKSLQALLLFLAILLPTSVVDTTIYKEIKSSGHPYLTALSIAGGVFCLGMEGAIMGPMILCCFLVIVNLSSNLIKDSTSETVVPVHLRRMRRKCMLCIHNFFLKKMGYYETISRGRQLSSEIPAVTDWIFSWAIY
ncbi:hypothetical protein J437_LFUL015934 [Ladona fulva]|uniref:Transmembrane protein 245 n=1 Tax=Ladona fulva TaxID=123851 RepID=A0A8K0NYA8_LADFU|nr:hypothetical protein J437_LFUL015934 [Ladona fulva]